MSRKATITQKEIVNAAFKITRKEGFEQISDLFLKTANSQETQKKTPFTLADPGAIMQKRYG